MPEVPLDALSLYVFDLLGTGVFAASGALAAGRRRMDLFGVLVVAAATAVGGGTLRDLLLDRHPVFWIADLSYLLAIVAAASLTFFYAAYFRPPKKTLLVADALGLAVFTIVGAQVALEAGTHPAIAVLMGVMTGTVGGMIRDVLCGDVPLILRREIYATASTLGGVGYLVLRALGAAELTAVLAAISAVFLIRLAAVFWHVHLPSFRPKHLREGES